ncbi:hypothetical protein N7452_009361 [Penicillium brevicompactum]|uniref:YTH domain-containing protein n=1 Tax=Penicillium brevicompactum TaxID=5074 RepID=A0A9W9UA59_PENBR|nr:hypothetical protein N7452_009361 [Penicillium brevicompactum]
MGLGGAYAGYFPEELSSIEDYRLGTAATTLMGHVPSDKTTDGISPISGTPCSQSNGVNPKSPTHLPTASSARPPNDRQNSGFTGSRYGSPSPLNMGNMSYALPGHHPQYDQLQYPPGQGMMYPMPVPYIHNAGMAYSVPYPYPPYTIPPHGPHYQQYGNQPMQNIPQHSPYPQGYYPYTNYHLHQGQMHAPVVGQAQTASSNPDMRKEADRRTGQLEYDVSKTIVDGSNPMKLVTPQPFLSDNNSHSHSAPSAPSTPRGPPRKPKQSGHALWVGNLPPGANVMDLKDHFSQDATLDIESVFLISKSNCAFVNYKSAAACVAALARFHDSRFQGVRVVCRLRKGFTVPGSGVAGSVGMVGGSVPSREDATPATADPPPTLGGDVPELSLAAPATGHDPPPARVVDRYFIVKSLATEDLELSKISGIWATQSHNEAAMNQAYETADYVYLIFSANKSGEYFGYARMMSPISDDDDLALEMPPRPDPPAAEDLDVTLTAATTTAPQGRIIDDSARGTIFWEVESNEDDARSEKSVEPEDPEEQTFGKPFRIEWVSTARVPFHRTRGLRNPWNANREIKIARDGTEIEPTIGRKLIQLFHA